MTLEWIEREGRDKDGEPFRRHHLIDSISGRVLGDIEEPQGKLICYWAEPDEGSTRRYLSLEGAKLYLELCAQKIDRDEAVTLEKSLTISESEKSPVTSQIQTTSSQGELS